MNLSSHGDDIQPQQVLTPLDLAKAAQEFAAEIAATAERKKKTIPAPVGIQLFLLYVRANGNVPTHRVSGAITVQTIMGDARLIAASDCHDLPLGSMVCIGAGVPHEVFANTETVLLVTHALQG